MTLMLGTFNDNSYNVVIFLTGNYCPVCKKCYEDDDFESKMVQCADCNRWVHAKCENLSGKPSLISLK